MRLPFELKEEWEPDIERKKIWKLILAFYYHLYLV